MDNSITNELLTPSNPNETIHNISVNDESEVENNSDDDEQLEIVLASPGRKRKALQPTEAEKSIIGSYEDDLEQKLGEKAAKMNFKVMHVKKLLRQVVSNDEVLAMVRNAENPSEEELVPSYEPKLTRSKAKELATSPSVPVPWLSPDIPPAVQVLVNDDLPEDDSSEDEYVPGDIVQALEGEEIEESADEDHDSSMFSDPPSVEPPTPPMLIMNPDSPRTEWSEDGVFKLPKTNREHPATDEATIALRTRSKLSLTSTSLDVIEEALIPPDLPPPEADINDIIDKSDKNDKDCENDDWMDFLKKFSLPLDEVVKATEDEEQDPEYNVLADEEIDEVDKEELRVDKAVKVSKKELVDLIAELFDGVDFDDEMDKANEEGIEETHVPQIISEDCQQVESDGPIMIEDKQVPLLQQQIAQHVQMLTQNFILTYNHPELHHHSLQMKEYLFNIKFLCDGKDKSIFHTINLQTSLDLINHWEQLHSTNGDDVKKMKLQIEESLAKAIHCHQTGTIYIAEFPSLILETISNSTAFVYPSILPKIPFKPLKVSVKQCVTYSDSEDHLIALGLEQFMPIVIAEKKLPKVNDWTTKKGTAICGYIHKYMMPYRESKKIFNHVNFARHNRCATNPIKHYFRFGRGPPSVHYIAPLGQVLPPSKRSPDELPYQWKQFIYPQSNSAKQNTTVIPINIEQYTLPLSCVGKQYTLILPKSPTKQSVSVSVPPLPVSSKARRSTRLAKSRLPRTQLKRHVQADPITKFVRILSGPSNITKVLQLYPSGSSPDTSPQRSYSYNNENGPTADEIIPSEEELTSEQPTMFPSMPMLGTPIKCQSDLIKQEVELNPVSHISSESLQQNIENEVEICEKSDQSTGCTVNKNSTTGISNIGKDNVADMNALMVASSTVRNIIKKEPSGAEKRKMKLKREFLANITIATPEDPVMEKQKSEDFAMAFYDKMREKLDMEDYHKVIQILNDFEKGDAVDLYQQIDVILRPKYVDLADEFLLFLRIKEASAVDKLIPWIRMNYRAKFLRKLEIFFKGQPSQLRKVYMCLIELSQTRNNTSEKIKSSLLPMFKGNSLLRDLFLQGFLDEPPPPSLLEGPYETMDMAKEMSKGPDDEEFETIVVPDVEDKYGGPNCICSCHEIEDSEFQSRYRHCTKCGAKFVNGRVFIQSGKGLRPAKVSFQTSPNVDHNIRLVGKSLTVNQKKKRSDSSPSKQTASSKEIVDDETDDDLDGKRKSKKKPQKRRKKLPEKSPERVSKQPSVAAKPRARATRSPAKKKACPSKKPLDFIKIEPEEEKPVMTKPGSSEGQQKRLADDSLEWGEENTAGDSSGEIKPGSPDQQTAESESEFCEESSQDNCESDSNSSVSSFTQEQSYKLSQEGSSTWKREEDKVILEVFQKENDKDNAFRIIAGELRNRTVDEIKSRFDMLMKLLMETIRHT